MSRTAVIEVIAYASFALLLFDNQVMLWHLQDKVKQLQSRVACLEHPHGESSIAAARVNGRFVITQPTVYTGCTR